MYCHELSRNKENARSSIHLEGSAHFAESTQAIRHKQVTGFHFKTSLTKGFYDELIFNQNSLN